MKIERKLKSINEMLATYICRISTPPCTTHNGAPDSFREGAAKGGGNSKKAGWLRAFETIFSMVRTAPVNATGSTTSRCAECSETFLGAVREPEASLSFQASKERWNDHGGLGQRRNYWL